MSEGRAGGHDNLQSMRTRFHLVAGLLAVLALTATAVGGLWASAQHAEVETRGVMTVAAVIEGPSIPDSSPSCPPEMARAHSSCHGGGNPDAPECPSMPLALASSCMGPVALPMESFPHGEPAPESTPSLGSSDRTRDLLLASTFFRPPIA